MKAFATPDHYNYEIQIAGVGVAGPNGQGAIPIERAAQVMPELQERDERGYPIVDEDGQVRPLSGSKLDAAAKAFADARGLVVRNISEEKLYGGDPNVRGALPELGPEGALAAAQAYAEQIGTPLATNTDPEEMRQSAAAVLPPSVIEADRAQEEEN